MVRQLSAAPLVSVLVPVRDRREELSALVLALGDQTLPREQFEVIVADDGSTAADIEAFATSDGWLRVSRAPRQNAYAALNRAAAMAKSQVFAICDSDCRPDANWLQAGLSAIRQSELVAGLIRLDVPRNRSVWTLVHMDLFLDQELAVQGGNGLTGNLFVTRKLFDRVGGFAEEFPSGGDYDFASRCTAIGVKPTFVKEAVVWHPTRDRARPLLKTVWRVHRWYSVRMTRQGHPPKYLLKMLLTPGAGVAKWRRSQGRSLLLDKQRLARNGVRPRWTDQLLALPVLYFLIPAIAASACLRGIAQENPRYLLPRSFRRRLSTRDVDTLAS